MKKARKGRKAVTQTRMVKVLGEVIHGIYCPRCRSLVVVAERVESAAYRCRQCNTVFTLKEDDPPDPDQDVRSG